MSSPREANQLKAQGVIEAAENPQSQVTAEDAQRELVQQSRNAGVAAFSFDADASVEQKRAQAQAAIPPELQQSRRERGTAIITDKDDGTGPDEDLPEPSKAGVLDLATDADGKTLVDGADPEAKEAPYSRTGWAPRFGWPSDSLMEGESLLDHGTWVEGVLPDTLYGGELGPGRNGFVDDVGGVVGDVLMLVLLTLVSLTLSSSDWYHNAAIIGFACISSWLVAVFGGGIGWVVIVMAICATYYRTSLRRVRRNFRDDIAREMSLKRLETDNESLEWINSFLVKFWPIYQPVLAQTIINSVDQVLSSATPAFLDSLKLKTFTLGSKPPRMEHVKTYPKTEDDIVMMDWKFSFMPNDTADMTSRQIKNKINPKVVLEIRIGKAMISKGIDVIVEDMAFSGIMRLKIKLQIPFPHVDRVDMCFLERPTIDYVCKPLGGESFGFDINFIPGLEKFILEQIHGNLAPMMYAPNVFPIEVAKMLAGTPVDQALGVVALTLHGAQGLKNTDKLGGTVDPYACISFSRRQELARTKTVQDNPNPRWNETHYLIVTSFSDTLDIQVFDKNEIRKSKELGVASFRLEDLEELNVHENERLEVLMDGKARGVVNCDLRFFPVLETKKLADGVEEPPPPSNQGILRFTVEQAKDLDGTKSLVGLLNPYAVMFLNGKTVHQTKKLKRTNNPIWDNGSKEILITDRKKAKLGVTIKDDRGLTGDQDLGKYQIRLDEMLDCMEQGKEWYQLAGAQTGRVKMMAQWRPVAITGVTGTGGYSTPIGVMRFHFKRATDLRNFEAFGKSDPYVRVLLSGIDKARTVTFKNDLNPEWDEVLYVPINSERDRLTLEVLDAEKVGKDRSLGLVEVFAGEYVVRGDNGEYLVNDTKAEREDGLRLHGKGISKGTLTYTMAFYPCLNIADPEDDEEEEEGDDKSNEKTNGEAEVDENEKEKATAADNKLEQAVERSAQAGKFKASLGKDGKNGKDGKEQDEQTGRASTESQGPPKVRLSPEELVKHESGLLVFRLLEAEMPEAHSRLEVWVDDMAYASYVSSTVPTKAYKFDEIGDCMIRELDVSRLSLKARKKGDDSDRTLAQLQGNTLETLKQCLNNPTTLKLRTDDGKDGWVKLSLKYMPIKMQLDASESINNMGKLRVDVLDGTDLPSADRNGKSDPYCKFELNGQEVYKTKVQKKTLSPAWNEFFEVNVPSRTGAKFIVNVYDYDFADKPDFLGAAVINLESLDPFKASESRYLLDGKSGSIRLRMLFRPDYVTRTVHGTSTFSGTFAAPGRIVTGVAGAPIKGGVAVAGAVGHGVGRGASFLRRGIFGKKDMMDDGSGAPLQEIADEDAPVATSNGRSGSGGNISPTGGVTGGVTAGIASSPPAMEQVHSVSSTEQPARGDSMAHNRSKSITASSIYSAAPGGAAMGTASITVVGASGFPASSDLYIVVSQMSPKEKVVGKTKHYKSPAGQWAFDETFTARCSGDAQFKIEAKGDHFIGSSDDLGEHIYFVDETGSGSPKDLSVGGGVVTVKSSFQPADGGSAPDTPKSHLRRNFLGKREGRSSRDVTPTNP